MCIRVKNDKKQRKDVMETKAEYHVCFIFMALCAIVSIYCCPSQPFLFLLLVAVIASGFGFLLGFMFNVIVFLYGKAE